MYSQTFITRMLDLCKNTSVPRIFSGVMSRSRHFSQSDTYSLRGSRDDIFLTPTFISELTQDCQFAALKRVDIRFTNKRLRQPGPLFRIIRKKVPPIKAEDVVQEKRAMDNASEGLDFPDDAIEKVAKANSVKIDTTQILPEVRASPCALHSKKDKKAELMYLNNYHGGNNSPRTLKPRKSLSKPTLGLNSSFEIRAQEKKYPPPLLNTLPRGMPSKEFVLTWLMHGSEPPGKSHFPEITEKSKGSRRAKKEQLRNSTISE